MKRLMLASLIVLAAARPAFPQQLVQKISWAELKSLGQLRAGEVQPGGELKVENLQAAARQVTVLELNRPAIHALQYALRGEVRYDDVADGSYLEMWNFFPGGGQYFTRTLADLGPMRNLSGSSDWRPFLLPFTSNAEAGVPESLQVNVVLTGRGTVYLRGLELVEQPGPRAWWDDRAGVWIGALGGAVLGCLGALIGTLGGMGKARRLVMWLTMALVLFGSACLVSGAAAWALGQPYAVYYPLLLGGLICTAVFGAAVPTLRQRYQQAELRKMAAMDLR